jgi:trimeric autotransporter adhesin
MNTTGTDNIAIGNGPLRWNTTGSNNTTIGSDILSGWPTGVYNFNTIIGSNALCCNSTLVSGNTVVGGDALKYANGDDNVAIGAYAGLGLTTWSRNILIGYVAQAPSSTGSNQVNIGNIIYAARTGWSWEWTVWIGTGILDTVAKLKVDWQIEITGGSPWVNKVLTSDAAGLATWQTIGGVWGITSEADPIWISEKSLYATRSSPLFTWDPRWSTPATADNDTSIATTAFVKAQGYTSVSGLTTNYLPKWNGTSLANSLIVDSGSNIGIWVINPQTKLHIDGKLVVNQSNSASGTMQIGNPITPWPWNLSQTSIAFLPWATQYGSPSISAQLWEIGANLFTGESWVFGLLDGNAGAYRFLVNSSGNMGIGTTNPWARLEVAWQVKITGWSPWAGKVLTSDASGLAAWQSNSERQCSGTGAGNTCYGTGTLSVNTAGNNNVAIWSNSLNLNINGSSNTAIWHQSLDANTSGVSNTAVGKDALWNNTTGTENVAIGNIAAAWQTTAYSNTAIWSAALQSNTSGYMSTAVGYQSQRFMGNSVHNVSLWAEAIWWWDTSLPSNNTGDFNTAVWYRAMRWTGGLATTGNYNTALWYSSLATLSSGSRNTIVGGFAGTGITTGSNNIVIGYDAQVPTPTGSNQIRLGDTTISYAGIQVAWTITSDQRWKTDIRDSSYGLDFIAALRPVSYIRKNDVTGKREFGFIAQDVESVFSRYGDTDQGMLTKTNDGYLELRYNDFISILAQSVKDLKALWKNSDSRIERLEKENEDLRRRLEIIESRLSQ